MALHCLEFESGERIGSGAAGQPGIGGVRLTRAVGSGSVPRLGAVCAARAQIRILEENGKLAAGDTFRLLRDGVLLGKFTISALTRPCPGLVELEAVDFAARLERDVTAWLRNQPFPMPLLALAKAAAGECGLELENISIPNGELAVPMPDKKSVTGRQLLSWCAELAGCFCHCTPEGALRFGRYRDSGVTLNPEDCLLDGVSLTEPAVEEAIGVRWAGGEAAGERIYRLSGNPLLHEGNVTAAVLEEIRLGVPFGYCPGRLQCVGEPGVLPGDMVGVRTRGGRVLRALVTTRVDEAGQVTLRSAGSPWAGDTVAEEIDQALQSQSQTEIFNKLTDNGRLPGLFMESGQLYINADYLSTGVIRSADGTVQLDLGNNRITIDGAYGNVPTRTELSAGGMRSYVLEDGAYKEVLQLTPGGPGQPTQLFNLYGDGLTVLPMEGVFTLGATVTPTVLRGSEIELWGLFEKLLSVAGEDVTLLGKRLSWAYDTGSGRWLLTGETVEEAL